MSYFTNRNSKVARARLSQQGRAASPRLEILEDRMLLATCNVTRLGDSGAGMGLRGSLRYCIGKTNSTPGLDVIEFRVTGTINLRSVLPNINDDLVIFGPGVNDLTIRRDTGGNYRIFTVNEGATAEIYNLTVTNGTGGILNLGTLTLAFAAVVDNTNNLVEGGGITNLGALTAHQVSITGNATSLGSGTKGGGIYNFLGATANVSFATITGNSAVNTNHNHIGASGGHGGGIYNDGAMSIESSTIADNAIHCTVYKNTCTPRGGGIFNGGAMSIKFSTIANNAITCWNYDYGCALKGGGIANRGGMIISESTIANNTVSTTTDDFVPEQSIGGGIYNQSGASLTIVNSTVAGNSATVTGEATTNTARGGGIYNEGTSLEILHSTISSNTVSGAIAQGSGVYNAHIIRNSIVSGNTGPGSDVQFGFSGEANLIDGDAMLGPLADNGGPTLTMELLPGSPAIDAGDNTDAPEFDQRGPGFPRIVNGTIDIGAFEVQATAAPGFLAFLITANTNSGE